MSLLSRLGSLSAINFGLAYTRKATEAMYLASGISGAPYVICHKVTSAGFGTQISSPSVVGTGNMYSGYGAKFSPDNSSFITTTGNLPFIFCFPFISGSFGSKYADPSSLPANNNSNSGCTFSPAGTSIAAGTGNYKLDVYRFVKGTGFGTKYNNPATLPAGDCTGLAFNPAGTAIAGAHGTSPYLTVYPWTEGTGFGTKYANPSSSINGNGIDITFSNSGGTIFVTATNYGLKAYNFSNGFQYQYSGSGIAGYKPGGVCVNSTDTAVFSTSNTSGYTPYTGANRWTDSSGFGTSYTNFSAFIYSSSSVAISPDDAIVASTGGNGYTSLAGFNVSTGYTGSLNDPSPALNYSVKARAFTNKIK